MLSKQGRFKLHHLRRDLIPHSLRDSILDTDLHETPQTPANVNCAPPKELLLTELSCVLGINRLIDPASNYSGDEDVGTINVRV